MTESPTERALRESLRRSAERAPDGTLLAERIIVAAPASERRVVHRSFRWQTWVTPLVSAAAVAAVAVAIVTTSQPDHHSAASGSAAGSTYRGSAGDSPGADGAGHAPSSAGPSATCSSTSCASHGHSGAANPTMASGTTPSGATSTVIAPGLLSGFRVSDLTFVSNSEGWALGTANCLSGSTGRCPAMMHTTDGVHWQSMPTPPIARGHAHLGIRFATGQIGYAFDPSVLFMTTDGGRHWQRQPGGALALETLDNNVVRLVSPHSGCPGPCNVQAQLAAVGSSSWSTVRSGGAAINAGSVQLARSGSDVYVLLRQNPAGGAANATSTLIHFDDTGSSWTSRGEPCPQRAGGAAVEVDTVAVAAATSGTVTALCQPREPGRADFVATSVDAGAHFAATPGTLPQYAELLAGDHRATLLAGGGSGVYRSSDGGTTWTPVAGVGPVRFLGFESLQVARAVSTDGRTIWTTTDGGASWQRTHFR